MWYDDYYDDDDDDDDDDHWDNDENEGKFFKWYNGYQKRRTQKAQIEKELLPISWHPSRYWDWCMSEDEKKKETEKLWA